MHVSQIREILWQERYEDALAELRSLQSHLSEDEYIALEGDILFLQGDLVQLIEFVDRYDTREYEHSAVQMANLLYYRIMASHIRGEDNLSQELLEQGQSIMDEIPLLDENYQLEVRAKYYMHTGNLLTQKGDLDEAENQVKKAMDIYQKTKNLERVATGYNNIGVIHKHQRNYDKAKENFESAFKLYDQIGKLTNTSLTFANLAHMNLKMGNTELAISQIREAIARNEEKGIIRLTVDYYFILVLSLLDNKDKAGIQEALTSLVDFATIHPSRYSTSFTRLCEALILKQEPNLKSRVKAQEILTELITIKDMDYDFTLHSMVNLVELLLEEYSLHEEKVVFEEIESIMLRMQQIASSNNLHYLYVDVLIFRSKIELIRQNYPKAMKYLDNAKELAQNHKLVDLLNKINLEKVKLEKELGLLEKYVQQSADIKAKIDELAILDYLKDIKDSIG